MNSMLHRLLRKDRDKTAGAGSAPPDAGGCAGVLLALSVALAAALLILLSA